MIVYKLKTLSSWLSQNGFKKEAMQVGKKLSSLEKKLIALKPAFAAAAQEVYDDWTEAKDEPGIFYCGVDDLNGGGICHLIADKMADVAYENGLNATTFSASIGEVHVWTIVSDGKEHFHVDISPYRYEEGGGYSWRKIPEVKFDPEDVTLCPADEFPGEDDF